MLTNSRKQPLQLRLMSNMLECWNQEVLFMTVNLHKYSKYFKRLPIYLINVII